MSNFDLKFTSNLQTQMMSLASEQESHPWKWFAPAHSKVLIVGTFPPTKRNWSYDFFYPNKANFFWRMMAHIAESPLQYFSGVEAVEERKHILEKLGIAITDMGHTIVRSNNSSLDENITAIQFMNIFQILEENPSIQKIIFTSSSGPNSAAGWFSRYLKSVNIIHSFPKGKKPIRCELEVFGKKMVLAILYSPSARAANRISFDQLVEMYRNEIK